MDNNLITGNEDIEQIKNQIAKVERKAEYEKLKLELSQLTQKTINEPEDYDEFLQIKDIQRTLSTKRSSSHFFELFLTRIYLMLSVKPIIGNIIGIGLAMFALYYIYAQIDGTVLAEYKPYLGTGMCIFAGIQVLKSSTRSLLLPVLTLITGSSIAHTIHSDEILLGHGIAFFQWMMGIGILGVGLSVLTID